jgi:hypothetical protein
MKMILHSIRDFISYLDETPANYELYCPVINQESLWAANLDNKLVSLQERLRYLSNRNGEMEKIVYLPHYVFVFSMGTDFLAQILNVVAFQTNISLDSHTEHMKRLADSNHETSREVAELGRQSREDAIYMRYLAELTMAFLPLTAVSVSLHRSLPHHWSHAQMNRLFSA